MTNINDMTEGKPLPLLLRFSLPMLFGNMLQLFYMIADSAVVGRMLGVRAFASVGATASLHFMVFSIILGIGHGFGIVFAQRFGAKDMDGLRRAFVTAVYLVLLIGFLIGCAGVLGSGLFLEWMDTPLDLMPGAVTYLSWLLGGMVITFSYNLLGGLLRALGDSKTPFKAMIASSVINIALNVPFAYCFGIMGVAAATLIAQFSACAYCYVALRKSKVLDGCGFGWHTPSAAALLRLGLPLGFRNGVVNSGGVLVQWYININFGTEVFIAGISVAKRMYSLLMVAGNAIEAANGTFSAQNFGAKRMDRVKLGLACGRRLMLISAAIIMAVTLPLSRVLLGLLFDGDPELVGSVLDVGVRQLGIMTIGLPLLYLLLLYRSTLEGIGKPLIPMLSGFVELVFRIACIFALTPFIGELGVMLSDPAGWVGALGLLAIAYYVIIKKIRI